MCFFLKPTKPAKSQTDFMQIIRQASFADVMQNSIQLLSPPSTEGIESASSNFEDHNTQHMKKDHYSNIIAQHSILGALFTVLCRAK